MKTLSITMEEPLLVELDQCVRQQALAGRSEAIRQAVRDWLKKKRLAEKVKKEIEAYKKKPVKKSEFGSLLSLQEFPS